MLSHAKNPLFCVIPEGNLLYSFSSAVIPNNAKDLLLAYVAAKQVLHCIQSCRSNSAYTAVVCSAG